MLTLFYERCSRYYGAAGGQGAYGCASDEEKKLTMTLFSSIFDSLSKMEYDAELCGKALPCLTAIACALPPDYAKPDASEDDMFAKSASENDIGPYNPMPINVSHVQLNNELNTLVQKFSEHYHDAWAQQRQESGWTYGQERDEEQKKHNRLKPYSMLDNFEKETYRDPIRDGLAAMLALGWRVEYQEADAAAGSRRDIQGSNQATSPHNYNPSPADLSNMTLSKEMMSLAERLAEDEHDIQARARKAELHLAGGGFINLTLVPFDLLTDKEKNKNRDRCQELVKYIQFQGYNLYKAGRGEGDQHGRVAANPENRFANNLLDKLISYLDSSVSGMKLVRPSANFTRRNDFKKSAKNVKFFFKVVLPVIEKYFSHHKAYFTAVGTAAAQAGIATITEKEYVATLFCKLSNLLRMRLSAFGYDSYQAVKCLQVLIKAVDARSLAKSRPEFVRTSMLSFFNNYADDLEKTIVNLHEGKYPHLRGTHLKTCTSFKYVFEVLVPVLTSTFDHLAMYEYGVDLLVDEIQVASYKIVESLYIIGTNLPLTKAKKFLRTAIAANRASIGTCLASLSNALPVAFLEPSLSKFNPHSVLGSGFSERSLEAQEVTARLEQSVSSVDALIAEVGTYVDEGKSYAEAPHIIDVILPFLCSYLPSWWHKGPDNVDPKGGSHITMVTTEHMNQLLKMVLRLIMNNIGVDTAEWMTTIATYSGQIIINTSEEILKDPMLPLAEKVRKRVEAMFNKEESLKGYLKAAADDASQLEGELQEEWNLIVRDIYALYPLLIKYVDLHKNEWIKNNVSEAEELYNHVGEIFNIISNSAFFKKEETNFVSVNEIDTMALIMPAGASRPRPPTAEAGAGGAGGGKSAGASKKKGKKGKSKVAKDATGSSLIVAGLKRLLPVGMNLFAGKEQEIVQYCKDRYLQKVPDEEITDFVSNQLTLPGNSDPADELSWQHHLYSTLGNKTQVSAGELKKEALDLLVQRIAAMGKVLYGLHIIDHPPLDALAGAFPKVVSMQRKRAVIACFRQTSLHSLPKHTAINLFLRTYNQLWLEDENNGQEVLIDHLTQTFEDSEASKGGEEEETPAADQLTQLMHTFCQGALVERTEDSTDDELYLYYALVMAKSCGEEEEEEEEEEGEGPSLQEQEIEKMRLLFNQGRLGDKGAADMVLSQISSCKGINGPMMELTLRLGISLLRGGNLDIQTQMATILKDKKDVGFFSSISALMNSCTVLNLDAFERNTKAEGLGVGPDGPAGEKNMHDAEFTTYLFRFLQLTAEGHNNEWQNYVRTQTGNSQIINLVTNSVDYLLRLQETMMDFYWYYSRKDVIDPAGKAQLSTAIGVASQVLNTLIEGLQGPCVGNQQSLAASRLWDAVSGFLFLFAHMQEKLSRDSSQVDLLSEILGLQNDLITLLLAMQEGATLNGLIGKQMVDTLVESSGNVELILQYFRLFLNLPGEEDIESEDGAISPTDLKDKLDSSKNYTKDEIDFLLQCCEGNQNVEGNIEYADFLETYLEPAKEIGFNIAVLLTNLSEHMPNDSRLAKFLESAGTVLEYFEASLGRLEIKTADKVERVYFQIDENNIEQWEKPQIKESKKTFFYNTITGDGDKEKMEVFVDFCEDAIFEMQMAESLMSAEDEGGKKEKELSIPSDDEPRYNIMLNKYFILPITILL
jgi:ryanodine receptor 2